jgi:hypothetical protein
VDPDVNFRGYLKEKIEDMFESFVSFFELYGPLFIYYDMIY